MSSLIVIATDGSPHPLAAAAAASGLRVVSVHPGGQHHNASATEAALVVATGGSDPAVLVQIEEAIDRDTPVLVVPDRALIGALAQRLSPTAAERVLVSLAARFEPPATAMAAAVAAGTLGLPWGIHIEALCDPRPAGEVALDLADLAGFLTASKIRVVERLGRGQDPLVLVPELDHGIIASLTIAADVGTPSILVRLDASHGQASADLLSPMLRLPSGVSRFGPTGHGLLLAALLAGIAPPDLRLPAVLARLAPAIVAVP